jgi:hypothetical protein
VKGRSLAVILLVGLVATLALARSGSKEGAVPVASPPGVAAPTPVPATPPPPDPETLRDVFRFADEPAGTAGSGPASVRSEARDVTPVAEGPRLVGLIRRGESLLAAVAVDGQLVLVRPGDAVGGARVSRVTEEGVVLRRADGSELRLDLP